MERTGGDSKLAGTAREMHATREKGVAVAIAAATSARRPHSVETYAKMYGVNVGLMLVFAALGR